MTSRSLCEGKAETPESANDDLENLLAILDVAVLFLGRDLRLRRVVTPTAEPFAITDDDVGRPVGELMEKICDSSLAEDAQETFQSRSSSEKEIESKSKGLWRLRRLRPYRTADGCIEGVVATYSDISALKKNIQRLAQTEKQQRIIADLGHSAIATTNLHEFFEIVCDALANDTGFDCTKIMELSADKRQFKLVAGFGWRPGLVGSACVPNSAESQAGYTAIRRGPVIVKDFDAENRFTAPDLLGSHGVRSGISCIIGRENDIWGVIGIHCKTTQQFSDKDGAFIQSVANFVYETIQRIERQRALAESEEILRLSLDAADVGVWRWEIDTNVVFWDEATRRIFGVSPDKSDLTLDDFFGIIYPDDEKYVRDAIGRTLQQGEAYNIEFRVICPGGETAWILARGDLMEIDGERILMGVNHDITQKKTLERQYELIARELDHRVKNVLATVMSMARMMEGDAKSVKEYRRMFQARMQSLATTHNLLSESRWSGARLYDLIYSELSPYENSDYGNIEIEGAPVTIEPHAAQVLSMAFHELTTNAAKYGALSKKCGKVNVKWALDGEGADAKLIIRWKELYGPKVKQPTTSGFGSKVLNELLVHQLRAEIECIFCETGVECEISLPVKDNLAGKDYARRVEMAPSSPGSRRAKPAKRSLKGLTILVVDDEWFVADAIADALRKAGAEVPPPAATIETAQILLREHRPDFAVVDYNIAGRPITPVAEKLVKKKIPILIITGYGAGLKLPPSLKGTPIAEKPVADDRLIELIENIIKGRT